MPEPDAPLAAAEQPAPSAPDPMPVLTVTPFDGWALSWMRNLLETTYRHHDEPARMAKLARLDAVEAYRAAHGITAPFDNTIRAADQA